MLGGALPDHNGRWQWRWRWQWETHMYSGDASKQRVVGDRGCIITQPNKIGSGTHLTSTQSHEMTWHRRRAASST